MTLPHPSPMPSATFRVTLHEDTVGAPSVPSETRFASILALLENGYAVSRKQGLPEALPASGMVARLAPDANPRELVQTAEAARQSAEVKKGGEWKPWFPVIDYDRCTNCMQCLSFCLFGVYGVDKDRRIQVQNQDNCKTNCPACSRVCPEAAIMFPKYKAGPINGDLVSETDLNREKMKVDISALLGGDVYSMLRLRSEKAKSRFSKERDADKALTERQKCLIKLASAGDIPPEVLMSLPAPEEIARRAEEAAAKARAALADRGE